MFFMVGVIYDRVHHRNLDEFGGLFAKMPIYSGLAFGIFFAGLGLPGLCGFSGEVFVTLSVWNFSYILAVISASVVILTAGYILWRLGSVFFGPLSDQWATLGDAIWRERLAVGLLAAATLLIGVAPNVVADMSAGGVAPIAAAVAQGGQR